MMKEVISYVLPATDIIIFKVSSPPAAFFLIISSKLLSWAARLAV
jgi:hypothetical protein